MPADSDDDYDDPLSVVGSGGLSTVAANVTVVAAATISASPLRPQVDADGAPILSQLALLPIVSPRAPSMNGSGTASTLLDPLTGVVKVSGDVNNDIDEDDVLLDRHYAPEDDFVDWNFSVKFFRFIRAPPSRPDSPVAAAVNGTAATTTAAVQGGRRASNTRQVMESSEADSNSSKSSALPAAARGGRGGGGAAPRGKQARGGGGGGRGKRRAAGYSSGDSDEDSSVERPSKAKGQLLPLVFFYIFPLR